MVDFPYRWKDWQEAKWVLNRLEDIDLYFAEAVLDHDDIVSHRKFAAAAPMRLCGGEMSTTRFEAMEWLVKGGVAVLQPDYNRCGGLTESCTTRSAGST